MMTHKLLDMVLHYNIIYEKRFMGLESRKPFFYAHFKIEGSKMLFTEKRYDRTMEKAMQLKPNFSSRGSGIHIVNRFQYSLGMCDCKYCLEYMTKGKGCTAKHCDFLSERLEAGAVSYPDLVLSVFCGIPLEIFQNRLKNIIDESEGTKMFYKGTEHKRKFKQELTMISGRLTVITPAFLAALFLLTSDNKVWNRTYQSVRTDEIDFKDVQLRGISSREYALFKAAQDIYSGTNHLTIDDITNSEIIDDNLLHLITNALLVRRYGRDVLKLYRNEGVRQ